ncbi:MAG: hypothetical protein J7K08_02110 [Thermoplasmata archaeon]|nr:hypothetical protein [Thermoplasmata archaeon]
MEYQAQESKGQGKSTPGRGVSMGLLVVFLIYSIWIIFMNTSESQVVEKALEVMEYRYWEYTGFALFALFILSVIMARVRAPSVSSPGESAGEGVRIEEYAPAEAAPGGITPVEKLAIPAKMAGAGEAEAGGVGGESEEAVYEYPPEVGPGIYGDTYIPISEGKMLKLRIQIVEPEYLGGGGD